MKISIGIVGLLALSLGLTNSVQSQELQRRASWEARFSTPATSGHGVLIRSLEKGSPLEKAGLLEGDRIIKVNDVPIVDGEIWSDVSYNLRGAETVKLQFVRGSELIHTEVTPNPLEKETHPELDTFYEEVTSSYGITQRTIITKPKRAGRQAAIVVIGGLSCSSIEVYPGRRGNWVQTLKDLVRKSGMVVMRIEKPGVGDSNGNCSEADFHTDIAGFKAAIEDLKSKPYVDPERIVVYGSSMGSALAPALANEHQLAGIISDGTFFKTWFEHMLEIERRIRVFQGDTESEIVQKMNNYYIPLYYGMLIEKKTYQEVVNAYPALEEYNYHGPRHMYGRPMAYYHQLQDHDLAGAWEKVSVPVRILRGTNDWIMSAFDNHMIMDVLERNGHKDHVLVEYPGLDHWNTIHETPKDSFEGKEGKWDVGTVDQIISWARELTGLSN
ncbi:alpha/beta fold hydrolase [Poritiphilus flavus]|uniref:Alpha/beta fold hydrolase n=1 Tax=Poritiphilus flavus TaxID=2697053 RepID=A0A6L9EDU0_9FLAO|nr:alpha/beta fold hydrolase [Poritiphilus flavus]NAS12519.1 alpha/beta fold hydrolase [Poritiphilus flavus]